MPNNAIPGSEGGVRGPALTKQELLRAQWRKAQAKYQKSEKRKVVQARYDRSEGARIIQRLWERSPSRRLQKTLWQQLRRQNGR